MRFLLIDRITDLREGDSITAIKVLTLAEEYLADHFPRFPVMPGVMMLESMYQACAWLVRKSEDFEHSIVVLREARNVKFSSFVEPGQVLAVKATIVKQDETTTTLKAEATVDGKTAVSAKLVLERYNLADRYPTRAASDAFTKRQMREQFNLLYWPLPVESVNTGDPLPIL
ncbi:MAG: 3-hydroxyacyl-ACP dehydratase FabZ family protein [Pirellulaceae bacterium]